MRQEYYGAMDGLRVIACIGIVLMHVAANGCYRITGFVFHCVIPSFTDFVFLFMTVSAFGLCCGYFDSMTNNQISLGAFYGRRFRKTIPFFGLLVLLDVALSPSADTLYEAFADLTLLFGFLPGAGNITVIGVGWFLGLVFVFYMLFPFFCVLLQNRRRAWLAFAVSLVYHFVCAAYFDVGRSNILYSGCYFLAGGLVYLYRREIMQVGRWAGIGAAAASAVLYYLLGGNTLGCLLVSVCWLCYAVICGGTAGKSRLLDNRVTHLLSGISMEIYLSHMAVFRAVEKLELSRIAGNGWMQYLVTALTVLCGTILFSAALQKLIGLAETRIVKMRKSKNPA